MDEYALVKEAFLAAVDAVRPENFIPGSIRLTDGSATFLGQKRFGYCDRLDLDLSRYEHVYIVSAGKAAAGMAAAADRILHPYITEGIILTKHIPENHGLDDRYRIMRGGHPVPTEESAAGAEAILDLLDKTGAKDLVLFLISGGGSALMAAPFDGISPDAYQRFCSAFLGCGADIVKFNTLRKHLDRVKGGRLALKAAPAEQVTVILSDVVGSPMEAIASGPTVPDPSTYRDALKILDHYADCADFPPEIRETLIRGLTGELPETAKPGAEVFRNSHVFLAADNRTAAGAAAERFAAHGFQAKVLDRNYTDTASETGRMMAEHFQYLPEGEVWICGGETTVTLRGDGVGGRNLEMALSAVRPLADHPGSIFAALGTDGEDGPTDAAGAFVTSETLAKALSLGCIPEEYLEKNDSLHFFEKVGGLIKTGPTGTNVNDLAFMIRTGHS